MCCSSFHQVDDEVANTVEMWVGQAGQYGPQLSGGHAPQLHHPQLLPARAHHAQLRARVLQGPTNSAKSWVSQQEYVEFLLITLPYSCAANCYF
jgi:hypothetical protein